jgi:hypothetical protein
MVNSRRWLLVNIFGMLIELMIVITNGNQISVNSRTMSDSTFQSPGTARYHYTDLLTKEGMKIEVH